MSEKEKTSEWQNFSYLYLANQGLQLDEVNFLRFGYLSNIIRDLILVSTGREKTESQQGFILGYSVVLEVVTATEQIISQVKPFASRRRTSQLKIVGSLVNRIAIGLMVGIEEFSQVGEVLECSYDSFELKVRPGKEGSPEWELSFEKFPVSTVLGVLSPRGARSLRVLRRFPAFLQYFWLRTLTEMRFDW
jgi:hypothetical protein